MADTAKESVAEALGKMGLTYQYHVCAEEVGQGATVDSADWKEPASGAQAPIEPGTRRFLVRLRYAVLLSEHGPAQYDVSPRAVLKRQQLIVYSPSFALRATASRRRRSLSRSRWSISTSLV